MTSSRLLLGIIAALTYCHLSATDPDQGAFRRELIESIQDPFSSNDVTVVVRPLAASERSRKVNFAVVLKMRDLGALNAKVAKGWRPSQAEMAADHLPWPADYDRLEKWLLGQGLEIISRGQSATTIFARGSIEQIESIFAVTFAPVTTPDGTFVSAVTAPSVPADLRDAVLEIDGLQPHLRLHSHFLPQVVSFNGPSFAAPSDVLAAYSAPSGLTGAGQTIAIIMASTVNSSDLAAFYTAVGSPQTINNITTVLVNGGPTAASMTEFSGLDFLEATMDVEWASAMAPGAKVRLYAIPDLTFTSIQGALVQILADAPTANITVVSMSVGGVESVSGSLSGISQTFAQLSAAGITLLASSGDGGSNPNPIVDSGGHQDYNASSPLSADYPASDPNVTGVGGTAMLGAQVTFSYLEEIAWQLGAVSFPDVTINNSGLPGPNDGLSATGGGISGIFPRPSWQTDGGSILTNPNRCVPDVAAIWGGYIKFQGNSQGTPITALNNLNPLVVANGQGQAGGGTSISAPIWAGIVALLNQARANKGIQSLGLLGPLIYPLHGTNAFHDITFGSNGAYSAGAGYDLCTGLGTPNITNLAAAILVISPPTITTQPQNATLTVGASFTLNVTAAGTGPFSYQWFLNGTAVAGQTSRSFTKVNAQVADAGSYTVLVSNSAGNISSVAATVVVNPAVVAPVNTPPPVSPGGTDGGGGGGGGAPSLWFYLALGALGAARKFTNRLELRRI
jgi:kumamolisin